MIIHFDPKTMHVQVICGISESFQPSEAHETLRAKVEEIKVKMTQFRDEVLNPALDEISAIVDAENKKFAAKA